MFSKRPITWSIGCCFLSLSLGATIAWAGDPVLTVKSGNQAQLVVDPNRTIRAKLPRTLFSANMQYTQFDLRHWDKNAARVKPQVISALKPQSGAFYRYPGGLASNTHLWEASVEPYATRLANRKKGQSVTANTLFGVDEYLDFISEVSEGQPWYTLNLLGSGTTNNPTEWSESEIATNNENLAKYLVARTPGIATRYYQLGNELDRNHFQWPHSKYVSRSLASINKILLHDPSARFVPFMREFNWTYKAPKTGVSTAANYFKDVMTGLPMVKDFSLHFYFDGRLSPNNIFVTVPDVVTRIEKAVGLAKSARNDDYNVWITEYGKRFFLSGGVPESGTSFDAALGVADLLIATSQMPVVKGAFMQGLDGGSRNFFYDSNTPTSAASAIRILAGQPYTRVLASQTTSPNKSGYAGGYDVRAVALTNDVGDKLGVNAVNRSGSGTTLKVVNPRMAGKTVQHKRYVVKAPTGSNPKFVEKNFQVWGNPASSTKRFSNNGTIYLWLPPLSISSFTLD